MISPFKSVFFSCAFMSLVLSSNANSTPETTKCKAVSDKKIQTVVQGYIKKNIDGIFLSKYSMDMTIKRQTDCRIEVFVVFPEAPFGSHFLLYLDSRVRIIRVDPGK